MGVLRHHHHRLSAVTAFALLFLASTSASSPSATTTLHPTRFQLSRGLLMGGGVVRQQQENKEEDQSKSGGGLESLVERVMVSRRLGGLGSAPPTCRSKCGRCTPCRAVHVPIQPGRSIPLEYYPEAWRCKCGNKIFMP
ncbi:hypothetical protein BVC80_1477g20 [Macleaya cordata]|uniref:Epidermal patterning factor-like protein n=1 Tax=Macleaya cordata TaxID=56857 RepID=A0A200PZ49_MACCD|nr:hypothetical protein BVC80_1477g20 [Macleaya cordata]